VIRRLKGMRHDLRAIERTGIRPAREGKVVSLVNGDFGMCGALVLKYDLQPDAVLLVHVEVGNGVVERAWNNPLGHVRDEDRVVCVPVIRPGRERPLEGHDIHAVGLYAGARTALPRQRDVRIARCVARWQVRPNPVQVGLGDLASDLNTAERGEAGRVVHADALAIDAVVAVAAPGLKQRGFRRRCRGRKPARRR